MSTWLVVMVALGAIALALPAGAQMAMPLADRPLFLEPLDALPEGPTAERVVDLYARQIVKEGRRYLIYNRNNDRLTGPNIYMYPGRERFVQLTNNLPRLTPQELSNFNPAVYRLCADPPACCATPGRCESAELGQFLSRQSSVTNLHTHGLHVSPQGVSDNVLLHVNRGRSNTYRFRLPESHAPGTHWYHAHLHGSTALQVQGGMVGALIVAPLDPKHGLDPPDVSVEEHIMVLRFGDGGCVQPNGEPCEPPADSLLVNQLVNVESAEELRALVGGLEPGERDDLLEVLSQLEPSEQPEVRVNGLEQPVLFALPSEVQRLRIVNAGSRRRDYKKIWIGGHDIYVAAVDGINLTRLARADSGELTECTTPQGVVKYLKYNENNKLDLAPGNRADAYFVPPASGNPTLMMESPLSLSERGSSDEIRMERAESGSQSFTRELVTFDLGRPDALDSAAMTEGYESRVCNFLNQLDRHLAALQLTPPYRGYLRPIGEPEIQREVTFDIGPREPKDIELPTRPPNQRRYRTFTVNGRDYNEIVGGEMRGASDFLGNEPGDGGRGPRNQSPWPLRAGTDEEWTIVNTSGVPHPFHIHVNPFWVYDIVEEGESVRARDPNDAQLNRWQDTISVPNSQCPQTSEQNAAGGCKDPSKKHGSVTVRMRLAEDFEGLLVLHCHILQHEDRGMMVNVLIAPKRSNEDPRLFFNRQRNANCRIDNQINNTRHPCNLPE